jgi:hypothetical protein
VYPKPVLDRITPSVNLLVRHVDQATGRPMAGSTAGPPLTAVVSGSRHARVEATPKAKTKATTTAAVGEARVVTSSTVMTQELMPSLLGRWS